MAIPVSTGLPVVGHVIEMAAIGSPCAWAGLSLGRVGAATPPRKRLPTVATLPERVECRGGLPLGDVQNQSATAPPSQDPRPRTPLSAPAGEGARELRGRRRRVPGT